jgi:hypothetical protein
MAQVVQSLPSKLEALRSNPSTHKKKNVQNTAVAGCVRLNGKQEVSNETEKNNQNANKT